MEGLDALRLALRNLPATLTEEASDVVDDATEITASSLRQSYPLGDTGNLRAGVTATVERNRFGVVGVVKSTSPHAHLWEFGTQNRRTHQGWNRGLVGEHRDGLVPIAQRNRRRMNGTLVELVRSAGFEVTGSL
jgi:hypothetical protein